MTTPSHDPPSPQPQLHQGSSTQRQRLKAITALSQDAPRPQPLLELEEVRGGDEDEVRLQVAGLHLEHRPGIRARLIRTRNLGYAVGAAASAKAIQSGNGERNHDLTISSQRVQQNRQTWSLIQGTAWYLLDSLHVDVEYADLALLAHALHCIQTGAIHKAGSALGSSNRTMG
jgi:hypothetical protein